MYKKFLGSILLLAVVATNLFLPTVASAQSWWAPTPEEFNQKVNDPGIPASEIFGERYTQAQVYWIIYSIQNFVFGTAVMECAAGSGGNPVTFATCGAVANLISDTGRDGGILGLALITGDMVSPRPASGIGYLQNTAQKMGFPAAYAQEGFGFSTALQPVLSIWAASRNAAYALMTLAVVILAFMVMFRTKISPQASVTVMSAIPRVMVGLLLITFSFAIAGFIVDLSYVTQGVIAALIRSSDLITNGIVGDSGWTVVDVFNQMNDIRNGLVGFGLIVVVYMFVLGAGSFAASGITGGASVIVFGVLALIVVVVFLIALFKVFWIMLKTYVMVLFHVIALPFAALGYVVSPSGNMFMQLLRSLAGHVSVFVTITVVVMFSHLIFWNMVGGAALIGQLQGIALFNPYRSATVGFPTGGGGMPGFGETDMSSLALFIGLIILLMAPSVANDIRSLISTGRPAREGISLIGAGLVAGVTGGVTSQALKSATGFGANYFTNLAGGTALGRRILAAGSKAPSAQQTNSGQAGSNIQGGGGGKAPGQI